MTDIYKKCTKCHELKPLNDFHKCKREKLGVKSACKQCLNTAGRIYATEYRDKNKDIINFKNKEWKKEKVKNNPNYYKDQYYKDHEKSLEKASKSYYKNHVENTIKQQKWRQENNDKVIQCCKKWRQENPEILKAGHKRWMQNNREHVRLYNQKKRAEKKQATICEISVEQLMGRMSVFGNKCAYCGGKFEHIDHVIPLSKGGPHCLSNLRPACASCNSSKHAKFLKDWYKR